MLQNQKEIYSNNFSISFFGNSECFKYNSLTFSFVNPEMSITSVGLMLHTETY